MILSQIICGVIRSIKNQKLTIINRKSKEVATDSRQHTPTITWQIQIRLTLMGA
jgi:hypothetical protein